MGKSLLTLACAATLAGGMLGGCTSVDKQVTRSSPSQPTTITLIDSINHEPIWTYDIPINHKIICDYDTNFLMTEHANPGEFSTSQMKWKLYHEDAWGLFEEWPIFSSAVDSGVVEINSPVRQIISYGPPVGDRPVLHDLPPSAAEGDPEITTDEPVVVDEANVGEEAYDEATEPAQDEGL